MVRNAGPGLTGTAAVYLACVAVVASGAAYLAAGGFVQDIHAQQQQDGLLVLTPLGNLQDGGNRELDGAFGVDTFTTGGKIYVVVAGHDDHGIQIVDVTNPSNPTSAGRKGDSSDGDVQLREPRGVEVFKIDNKIYAAVVGEDDAVQIMDLTDPTSPDYVASLTDTNELLLGNAYRSHVFESGNSILLAVPSPTDHGLQIVNVTDPTSLTAAGNLRDGGNLELEGAAGVDVFERDGKTYAAVTSFRDSGLQIVNITNPNSPTPLGNLHVSSAFDVAVFERDGKTYAAVTSHFHHQLSIIDITDPSSPSSVGSLHDTSGPGDLLLDGPAGLRAFQIGAYSYVAVSSDEGGLQVVNVTDPANPVHAGNVEDGSSLLLSETRDVDIFTSAIFTDGTPTGTAYYAAVTSFEEDGIQIVRLDHPDNVRPLFVSATLDEDTRMVTVTFTEPIDVSETDLSRLYVSDAGQTDTVSLTGAAFDPNAPDSATMSLTLTMSQIQRIIPMDTPQLDIAAGAASDLAANTIGASPDSPITVVVESTPPTAVSAMFEGNTLTIEFDEAVEHTGSDITDMLLSDGRNSLFVDIPDGHGMTLDVGVSDPDADTIRQMNNPVLHIRGGAFVDNYGAQNEAHSVSVTVEGADPGDTTPPTMVSATFDRNDNGLTVRFDEPVELSPGATVLFALGSDVFIHHTERGNLSVNMDMVTLTVDQNVMDELGSHTLLTVAASVFEDLVGNRVNIHSVQYSIVDDTTAPVISLIGADPLRHELADPYADPGATSDDGSAVSIDDADVDVGTEGDYTVTYTATDSNDNTGTATRTVQVRDTTAPVITINGNQNITLELGGAYSEQGASVSDNDPAYAATEATVGGDTVDTGTAGAYVVTYTAPADDAGTEPEPVSRIVTVQDTNAPVITLNGANPLRHELGDPYTDPGAEADDGSAVTTDATAVDVNQRGDYTVTYTATDGEGNKGVAARTVQVRDTTKPVIDLNGGQSVTVELDGAYAELGAGVTDNDPDYATTDATVGGDAVDAGSAGVYVVNYTAPADDAGNEPEPVYRTVTVQDTTPPSFVYATFDFEAGILTVAFDQTIDVSELTATSVYVAGQINGSAVVAHPVVDTASDSEVIVFQPVSIDRSCDMSVGVGSSVKDLVGNSIEPSVFPLTLINAPESPPCRETPATRNAGFATGGFKTTSVLASNAISYNVCDPSKDGAVRALTFNRPAIGEIGLNVYAVDSVSLGVDITGSVPASTYLSRVSPDYVYTVWEAAVPKGVGKFFVTVFDRDDGRVASAVLVDTTRGMECMGSIFPHELKDPRAEILPIGHVEQGS